MLKISTLLWNETAMALISRLNCATFHHLRRGAWKEEAGHTYMGGEYG
jgi:hypothetical protein